MCEWYPALQTWGCVIVHILRHRTTASLFLLITYAADPRTFDVFLCVLLLLISLRIPRPLNTNVLTSFPLHPTFSFSSEKDRALAGSRNKHYPCAHSPFL